MSAIFHLVIIVAGMISLPWLRKDFEIPQPISVEIVDISKVTETNKVSTEPAKKDEKKSESVPKPKPPAKNTSNEAVEPVKSEKKEIPDKKEDTVLVDKNAPPEKKKTPKEEKKKETTSADPKKDFSSVLKNLQDVEDTPPVKSELPDLKLDETPAAAEGQNAPLGQRLTMSEEDALRRQLEGCWSVPLGAKDAETLRVEIFMVINPDRTLRESRVVDTARYNSDTFFRAAADSALRAVRNPLCSPFMLPPDKYDTWKTTTVTFDPSQMF